VGALRLSGENFGRCHNSLERLVVFVYEFDNSFVISIDGYDFFVRNTCTSGELVDDLERLDQPLPLGRQTKSAV
jgi:hypothetical protein